MNPQGSGVSFVFLGLVVAVGGDSGALWCETPVHLVLGVPPELGSRYSAPRADDGDRCSVTGSGDVGAVPRGMPTGRRLAVGQEFWPFLKDVR